MIHLLLPSLAIAMTAWLMLVALTVYLRMRPPRLTDYKAMHLLGRLTPADLQLSYQRVRFAVNPPGKTKAIPLAGWFVPHPQSQGRCVVLLHGYADAKVGAAAWLPLLHRQELAVLLLDLPAHGESGGRYCTAGITERHAIREAIEQFRQAHPDQMRQVILFGISMGAAIALCVTADAPRQIAGVILDSPYADFGDAVIRHARHFGLPGRWTQAPASWIMERMLGCSFEEVAPRRLIPQVDCPLLLLQSGEDPLIDKEDAAKLHEQVQARGAADHLSRAVNFPEASHLLGLLVDPAGYENAVAGFVAALEASPRETTSP